MEQSSPSSQAADLYQNFKIRIKFADMPAYVAGFSRITALDSTTEGTDYREGDVTSTVRIMPGLAKFGPITLERGITHDVEFAQWANMVWNDGSKEEASRKDFRRNIIVDVFNEAGLLALRYILYRCWVVEYGTVPELDASARAVAIDTLTVQNEGRE